MSALTVRNRLQEVFRFKERALLPEFKVVGTVKHDSIGSCYGFELVSVSMAFKLYAPISPLLAFALSFKFLLFLSSSSSF